MAKWHPIWIHPGPQNIGIVETQKHLLIIDDNNDTAQMLEDFLTESGFLVAVAFTAEEGLQKISNQRPDLIVLDLYLPDMMGSDLCVRLRNNPSTRDIPVILCTAHQISMMEKMKGFKSGVDDYMIRPFELAELLARIQAILRRSQLKPKTDLLADIQAIITTASPTEPSQPNKIQTPVPSKQPIQNSSQERTPISSPAPTATRSGLQPKELLLRFVEILHDPKNVYSHIKPSIDFFLSVAMVLATPVAASLGRMSEKSGGFDAWIGVFSLGVVTNVLMWFGMAGLLQLTLPFQGLNLRMRPALIMAGLAWAPRLIGALLTSLYSSFALAFGILTEAGRFSSGLDLIPGLQSFSWGKALGYVGIFDIWSMILTVMGVWVATEKKDRKLDPVTIIVGATCLLFGLLTHY